MFHLARNCKNIEKTRFSHYFGREFVFLCSKTWFVPFKHSRMVRHMGETIQRIFSKLYLTTFAKAQKKKN